MPAYVAAIDQGTTSTRFTLIDRDGRVVVERRQEHRQIMPRPGWVEHDPQEIWASTRSLIGAGMRAAGVPATQVAALGITNQRETAVVLNRHTGMPYAKLRSGPPTPPDSPPVSGPAWPNWWRTGSPARGGTRNGRTSSAAPDTREGTGR